MNMPEVPLSSRREFLKTSSSAALAGAILAPQILRARAKDVSPGETLKVGLVGCGGRGTGAAAQALKADANIELIAVADAFDRPIAGSLKAITTEAGEDKVKVPANNKFVGLDAYQKVI